MAGGDKAAWEVAEPVLTSIAARYEGSPCAAYFGTGGAGHYVKTVHNGIEYADMQMIAEIYGLMRDGQGAGRGGHRRGLCPLERRAARKLPDRDRGGGLGGDRRRDRRADASTLIADRAGQKGTGRWTVIDAQRRAAPLPAVEAAVTARVLSGEAELRAEGARLFPGDGSLPPLDESDLEGALLAGKILAYSQGFTLLARARAEEGWVIAARYGGADMAGGVHHFAGRCSTIMARALAEAGEEPAACLRARLCPDDRRPSACPAPGDRGGHVCRSAGARAFGGASAFRPACGKRAGRQNMIQGLRDRFGAHGFERIDRPGETGLHGPWGGDALSRRQSIRPWRRKIASIRWSSMGNVPS